MKSVSLLLVLALTACTGEFKNGETQFENDSFQHNSERKINGLTRAEIGRMFQGGILVTPDLVAAPDDYFELIVDGGGIPSFRRYHFYFKDAINACKTITINGYNDWRVPTRNELKQLYNYYCLTDANGYRLAKNFATWAYWSSEQFDDYNGWRLDFSDGGRWRRATIYSYENELHKARVRFVRNIK